MTQKKNWNLRLMVVVLAFCTLSLAQSQMRITQPINGSALVRIPQSKHPLANARNDRGRLSGSRSLERMVLVLKPSDAAEQELSKFLDAQQNRDSSQYHRWLSPDEFGNRFGVSDADLQQLTSWLQQNGFHVDQISHGRLWIEFSGSAAQVENAFHTEMHNYSVNGEKHIANATDISLPQALTPVVKGVLSLHDFRKKSNLAQAIPVHRDQASGKLVPNFTISNGNESFHFLAPGDYRKIYNTETLLKSGIDGSGVSIAVVGRTNINLSDVRTFRKIFGLPENDPVFIVNGKDPGINGDEVESALDVEWSGAVAPKATIKFVTTNSTFSTDGVDLSASYIVDNVVAPIMSMSYSLCEAFLGTAGNEHFTRLYQQAAAEGITVFVSTGDNGPAGCDFPQNFAPAQNGANVSGLSSTPYNVSVGGTQFREQGLDGKYWLANNRPDLSSAVGYIPEGVWNESCDPTTDPDFCFGTGQFLLTASSGGPSSCSVSTVTDSQITCVSGHPKPAWQAGIGVPDDGVRDLPDVSLAAAGHDGYLICLEGSCQTTKEGGQTVLRNATVISGTSASTPSMAAIMAMLEQANGQFQGLANYALYQLAAGEDRTICNSSKLTDPTKVSACIFNDVTAGNTDVPGQAGYKSVRGYDMGTGLGSINAANLVSAWASAQRLGSHTTLSADATTVQHGQSLGLNVTVKPAAGTGSPTGDFALLADNQGVPGGSLTKGKFSGPVDSLPGGTHTVRARYSGDAMFSSSDSNALTVHVTPEPSTTTATAWTALPDGGYPFPADGPIGYNWTFGLQLDTRGKSGIGSPTGKATVILDKTKTIGTYPLADGSTFVFVKEDMHPGYHQFTVEYQGDKSFQPSTTHLDVPIKKGLPSVQFVDTAPNQVTDGSPVLLLISVLGSGFEAPSGSVEIFDNGKKLIGPIQLQTPGFLGQFGTHAGQATTKVVLPVGDHTLSMQYSGDGNYLPNALYKPRGLVTVTPKTGRDVRVGFTQTPTEIFLGQSANYLVTVRPAKSGGPVPTGMVNLVGQDGIEQAPAVPLVNGNATFIVPAYFGGGSLFIANYAGDANYSAGTSSAIITRVKAGTPSVVLTPSSLHVDAGKQTSLTVSVIGQPANKNLGAPRGLVQFVDTVNGGSVRQLGGPQYLTTGNGGISTYTLPVVLPAGTNVIHAKYLGSMSGDIPNSSPDWAPTDSNDVTVEVK